MQVGKYLFVINYVDEEAFGKRIADYRIDESEAKEETEGDESVPLCRPLGATLEGFGNVE